VVVWALRIAWLALPLTAGPAVSDALAEWSSGPRIAGSVLLWVAWAVGLLATLAPRPIALTVLRALAPAFVVVAVVVVIGADVSTLAAAGALLGTLAVAALAMHPDVAMHAVNGIAYGDEQRFPLRTPVPLFFGPLPLVRAVAVGGLVVGPLLLADGDAAASGVALALGLPASYFAFRALHTLSKRWLVLVPAGVVLVDPMTLADAVLMPREHIRAVRALDAAPAPPGALDLRLGASAGSTEIALDQPGDVVRAGRGRRRGDTMRVDRFVVAVTHRQLALETAARRRVRIEVR
jgi:hypothetical protein